MRLQKHFHNNLTSKTQSRTDNTQTGQREHTYRGPYKTDIYISFFISDILQNISIFARVKRKDEVSDMQVLSSYIGSEA